MCMHKKRGNWRHIVCKATRSVEQVEEPHYNFMKILLCDVQQNL